MGGGRDFEYHTSPDEFLVVRCTDCDVVYLDPRPVDEELARIYPDDYHAYDFDAAKFGLIYRARRKLEGRRIMAALRDLPTSARILDIGCGDGFHLDLVREFGSPNWEIEGIDVDDRAVGAARDRGLTVHLGVVEKLELPDATFDAALMIMVVEHVADPLELLKTARRLIRPGGRLVVVTDNTGSPGLRFDASAPLGRVPLPTTLVPVQPSIAGGSGPFRRLRSRTNRDDCQPGQLGVLRAQLSGRPRGTSPPG